MLRDTIDRQTVFTTAYARSHGADDVFEWFGAVCPEIAGGAPAPALLASGQGEIYFDSVMDAPFWFTFDPSVFQPAATYSNGVEGVLRTPDGDRVRLVAQVRYEVDANGRPTFKSQLHAQSRSAELGADLRTDAVTRARILIGPHHQR